MRINEIESKDEKIHKLMNNYFSCPHYTITDGVVNTTSHCALVMPVDKLPVKFGITGDFDCQEAGLVSLEGSPHFVEGQFFSYGNKLTTLKGGPEMVTSTFTCNNNQLTTLKGSPKKVGGSFFCMDNPLISLEGLPEEIHEEFCLVYNPTLPLLKLLFVNYLQNVFFREIGNGKNLYQDVSNILNKYLGQGRKGAVVCAAELTKAGYKGNAKL